LADGRAALFYDNNGVCTPEPVVLQLASDTSPAAISTPIASISAPQVAVATPTSPSGSDVDPRSATATSLPAVVTTPTLAGGGATSTPSGPPLPATGTPLSFVISTGLTATAARETVVARSAATSTAAAAQVVAATASASPRVVSSPSAAAGSPTPTRPYIDCQPHLRGPSGTFEYQPIVWLNRPTGLKGSWPLRVSFTEPRGVTVATVVANGTVQSFALRGFGHYWFYATADGAEVDPDCSWEFEHDRYP
jgi:hypothetical protein